jgi:hypothetical protein
MNVDDPQRFARNAARVALVGSAAGSLALMFYAGRRQPSAILIALFTMWVASPFAGLLMVDLRSTAWPAPARRVLHGVMLAVAVGSLAVYGTNAVTPLNSKGAFLFLVVPAAAWLLSAIVLVAATRRAG